MAAAFAVVVLPDGNDLVLLYGMDRCAPENKDTQRPANAGIACQSCHQRPGGVTCPRCHAARYCSEACLQAAMPTHRTFCALSQMGAMTGGLLLRGLTARQRPGKHVPC